MNKKKCHKCGKITDKGTYQTIAIDPEKDEIYDEFFCEDCGPQTEEIKKKIEKARWINQKPCEYCGFPSYFKSHISCEIINNNYEERRNKRENN